MLFLGICFGTSRYCFSLRCFSRDFCSFFLRCFFSNSERRLLWSTYRIILHYLLSLQLNYLQKTSTFAVLILACKVKGGFTLRSKSNRGVIDRHGRIAGEIHFENLACSAASQSVLTSQASYSNKHLAGGRTTFLSLSSTTFEFTFL
jgi:hypothetical protein